MSHYFWSLFRFCLLSLFSFSLTFSLTSFTVEVIGWVPIYAHVLTLSVVMLVNGWLLVRFVFPSKTMARGRFLRAFLGSTLLLRVIEWCIYALLVSVLRLDYQLSILFVSLGFALIKFVYLRACAYAPERMGETKLI